MGLGVGRRHVHHLGLPWQRREWWWRRQWWWRRGLMTRSGLWGQARRRRWTGWRTVSMKGSQAPPVTAGTTIKVCDGIQRLLQRLSLLCRCGGVLVMGHESHPLPAWSGTIRRFCACHPCAEAMLIFSVSFQFYYIVQSIMVWDLPAFTEEPEAEQKGCRLIFTAACKFCLVLEYRVVSFACC